MTQAFAPLRDFVNDRYAQMLLVLFAVVSFSVLVEQAYMPILAKILVPWLCLIAVINASRNLRAAMLLIATVLLFLNVLTDWYRVANHSFMISFIGLGLFLMVAAEEKGADVMRFMARYILCALMALALVQKLISPYYMSGNLMADYILNEPSIFSNLINLFVPDHLNTLHQINQIERNLVNSPLTDTATRPLQVSPLIPVIAMMLTYASLFWQAALEAVLLFKSKLGLWTHRIIIFFVLIIYATVDENEFLSMNCLLGYAMTDDSTKRARFWYVLMIFFLLGFKLTGIRLNLIS
ncbi:MAG: hypothetical protein AAF429_05450 [Pseudomonadota bacterium]